MYCPRCKSTAPKESVYCGTCGGRLEYTKNNSYMPHPQNVGLSNRVIAEAKPIFRPVLTFIFSIVVAMIMNAFFGSMVATILTMIVSGIAVGMGLSDAEILLTITVVPTAFLIISFILIAHVFYKRQKRNTEHTSYILYEDRIVYSDKYRLKQQHTIFYRDIVGLQVSSSPRQEKLGVGDVQIKTAGNSTWINITNIPNFEQIADIINKQRA